MFYETSICEIAKNNHLALHTDRQIEKLECTQRQKIDNMKKIKQTYRACKRDLIANSNF